MLEMVTWQGHGTGNKPRTRPSAVKINRGICGLRLVASSTKVWTLDELNEVDFLCAFLRTGIKMLKNEPTNLEQTDVVNERFFKR